jgi:hypothetical protein
VQHNLRVAAKAYSRVSLARLGAVTGLDAPTLDAGGIHDALRACIAKGVVGPHADFATVRSTHGY